MFFSREGDVLKCWYELVLYVCFQFWIFDSVRLCVCVGHITAPYLVFVFILWPHFSKKYFILSSGSVICTHNFLFSMQYTYIINLNNKYSKALHLGKDTDIITTENLGPLCCIHVSASTQEIRYACHGRPVLICTLLYRCMCVCKCLYANLISFRI